MALKKVLGILLVIFMVFSIAACGINLPGADKDDDSEVSSRDKDDDKDDDDTNDDDDKDNDKDEDEDEDEDEDDKDDDEDEDDKDDDEDEDDTDEDDEDEDDEDEDEDDDDVINPLEGLTQVDLPDGFPIDDYTFIKGTVITYGTQTEENGRKSYIVSAICPKTVDDVKSYYNTLLIESEDKQDSSGDGYFTVWGKFAGYEYYVMLSEDTSNADYTTMMLQITEVLTPESALENEAEAELPDDYPVDLFPIIDSAKVYDATESESGGVVSFDIQVYTMYTFKEIVTFYEENLGAIEDKSKSINSDGFSFSGTANGYYFYMGGYPSSVSGVDLQSYYINLDPVE